MLPSRISIITAYDREAGALFDAWRAAGAASSSGYRAAFNRWIRGEKNYGGWQNTDDYWGLAAENAAQSLVSIKQLRTATATSTFAALGGYTGNGTSTFYNTGFIPTTHAVAMTLTSARIAMYLNTTGRMGAQTASGTERLQFGRIGGAQISMGVSCDLVSGTGGGFASPVAWMAASRSGSTWVGWQRGVAVETIVPTPGTALPNVAIYIGAVNNNGSFASGSSTQHRFACVGAALTAAQEAAQYNNLQNNLMTPIGAQL